MTALMLTSLVASSVSLLADHETVSLILTLPTVPLAPLADEIVTLLLVSALLSAAPVSSPPLACTVKSFGSINHEPVKPFAACVVILKSLLTLTLAALVSMAPPLPPLGAEASSVPPTFTVPAVIPPNSVIVPVCSLPRFCTVRASITPVLLTTEASSELAAPAVITIVPPSARIKPPFSARLFKTLWSTCMCTRLLPLKVSVTALPAPSPTVPNCAVTVPWLLTWLPNSAT